MTIPGGWQRVSELATRALLEVRGLTVAYGPVLALDGVTLEVAAGGSTCLLGPNGAGKTTLLRAVSGLLRFHGGRIVAGEIRYDGRVVTGADPSKLVAGGMAQVLEGRRVFTNLSVDENLRAGPLRRRHDRAEQRGRVLELFPRLAERLGQPAGLLSGGEQQMLAVARALMSSPRLLLLDEPSLGLAPLVTRGIGEALAAINQSGVTLLVVEQSSSLAQALTRDGYLIETGVIRATGPISHLLADEQVQATYLGVKKG
jgi:ABC-type branched-subunit amino acid transport system ATPase component